MILRQTAYITRPAKYKEACRPCPACSPVRSREPSWIDALVDGKKGMLCRMQAAGGWWVVERGVKCGVWRCVRWLVLRAG